MLKTKKRPFIKKNHYEYTAWSASRSVCGIDEVGRGCLAGPLVTAAVILPVNTSYRLLKDSKEMTPEERLKAYRWITKNCYYAYGIIHHRLIDKKNIWQATLIGMHKAVMHLAATCPIKPDSIVVDAMPLKVHRGNYKDVPIYHFPFGEKKSSSIAAASIIAKVKRDAMMLRMDKHFPRFAWHSNKGYGTPEHKEALKMHAPVILHRKTFLKFLTSPEETHCCPAVQQTLFSEDLT